jgi:hypothetical protein
VYIYIYTVILFANLEDNVKKKMGEGEEKGAEECRVIQQRSPKQGYSGKKTLACSYLDSNKSKSEPVAWSSQSGTLTEDDLKDTKKHSETFKYQR